MLWSHVMTHLGWVIDFLQYNSSQIPDPTFRLSAWNMSCFSLIAMLVWLRCRNLYLFVHRNTVSDGKGAVRKTMIWRKGSNIYISRKQFLEEVSGLMWRGLYKLLMQLKSRSNQIAAKKAARDVPNGFESSSPASCQDFVSDCVIWSQAIVIHTSTENEIDTVYIACTSAQG